MKSCGRSHSAAGFNWVCRPLHRSQLHGGRSSPRQFIFGLTVMAVALAIPPAFAINSGPPRPRPSGAGVYPSTAEESPAYADGSPPSASPDSAAASPTIVGGAGAAIDTPSSSDQSVAQNSGEPASTSEIPSASDSATSSADSSTTSQAGQQTGPADYDDGIISYEKAKEPGVNGPPIGSLDDFMSEGDITSPLGIEVREDKRPLTGGGEVQGLLIEDVFAGSPAARAGLHPYHRAIRDALETAAVAGAMFCPPAVLLVPVFDQVRLGESYDLIIGVDGSRVTNFLDFQNRMRDVQGGEIVYFSIIRNGRRTQVQVPVPDNLGGPTF